MPPFFGENSAAAVEDPLGPPHARVGRDTSEQATAPPAPRDPETSVRRWRLEPPGGAPGRGSRRSPGSLSVSAASRSRRPSSRPSGCERTPFPGADARPTEKSGPVSGAGVAFEPPYPSPEESLAPPPGAGPLRGRDAPRGWTVEPSGPGPPTSEERPPPRGRAPTRAPLQPAAISPRRPMPSSPGPRQRPPPAAAGGGAKRGLQPLGAPAPARGLPSPSAGEHSPPTRPATGRGGRPARGAPRRRTGQGALRVTLAHPFPEETLAGREPRAPGPRYTRAGRAPRQGAAPGPARWARGSPPPPPRRDALSPACPRRAHFRCNAAILTPAVRNRSWGVGQRSSCSPETLCPRRRRRLCSPG